MVKQIKTTPIKTPSLAPSKKFTSDSYDLITQNKPINDISRLNSKQGTTNYYQHKLLNPAILPLQSAMPKKETVLPQQKLLSLITCSPNIPEAITRTAEQYLFSYRIYE